MGYYLTIIYNIGTSIYDGKIMTNALCFLDAYLVSSLRTLGMQGTLR